MHVCSFMYLWLCTWALHICIHIFVLFDIFMWNRKHQIFLWKAVLMMMIAMMGHQHVAGLLSTSLWVIDEQTESTLMLIFYTETAVTNTKADYNYASVDILCMGCSLCHCKMLPGIWWFFCEGGYFIFISVLWQHLINIEQCCLQTGILGPAYEHWCEEQNKMMKSKSVS